MNLGELIKDLMETNLQSSVYYSSDSEGNSFSKLDGFYLVNYEKTCGWSGTITKEHNTKNALVLSYTSRKEKDLNAQEFIEMTKDLDLNLEVVISKYKGEGSPYDGYADKYLFDDGSFNGPYTLYDDEFDWFIEHYQAKMEDFLPIIVLFPVN